MPDSGVEEEVVNVTEAGIVARANPGCLAACCGFQRASA